MSAGNLPINPAIGDGKDAILRSGFVVDAPPGSEGMDFAAVADELERSLAADLGTTVQALRTPGPSRQRERVRVAECNPWGWLTRPRTNLVRFH